jgi:hypothetical protein
MRPVFIFQPIRRNYSFQERLYIKDNFLKDKVVMAQIHSRDEIIHALKDSARHAEEWFRAQPEEQFFTRHAETWSASDNVDHLIKAIKPIIKALKLPKVALQTLFGKPVNQSRTYEEICTIYSDEIAKGARAGGSFLPLQEDPDNAEEKKAELLQHLSLELDKLVAAIEKWQETELDEVQLPHPIIGKITVREMLFFTIHHNLRHASNEGD